MTSPPSIIYEDRQILVIIKPAGWLSQPDGRDRPDVLQWARGYLETTYNKPGRAWVGLCHRLDLAVRGIMVLAKTSKSASRISKQFRERDVKKIYHALCVGSLKNETIKLSSKLTRVFNRTVEAEENGAAAELIYKLISTGSIDGVRSSLLEIELLTGFKHQIRSQLSSIGHPIWGDVLYDGPKGPAGAQSIGLMAERIEFNHPISGERLSFSCRKDDAWPWNSLIENASDNL
ncbi:MAG: RluA family pseudouridine synthase [Deltaproteobacteria bacterium]|nr:RluA family pseudouridine synthase [Deltaproteobacteria bacterium]